MLNFEFNQLSAFQFQLFLPVVPVAASVKTKLGRGRGKMESAVIVDSRRPQRQRSVGFSDWPDRENALILCDGLWKRWHITLAPA